VEAGEPLSDEIVSGGGVMSWLFGKTFRLVSRSWQMYLVGFLFGLGFDTATEIGVLGISAAGASSGISVWSIMVFPALFASGMALVDTLDNVLMVGAYGWAFSKPQRKLYYNMTITGTSVVVALFIGGLEALGLLMDKFALSGGIWRWVGALNDNPATPGLWWSGCLSPVGRCRCSIIAGAATIIWRVRFSIFPACAALSRAIITLWRRFSAQVPTGRHEPSLYVNQLTYLTH
jgi:HoxN/HupN/NixA family high-affinity nickel-transporter